MQTLKPKIPGIYLNQIIPTPEPELLTGVPLFLGLAKTKVDHNKPLKLTRGTQFDQYFFNSLPQGKEYLRDAVKGFFENGGRLCYVVSLYAPWLKIEERPDFIPPCGHIAGIYANSDRRGGTHKAPANIELEGVLDLSLSLSPREIERLNPTNEAGVNCIRSLRGRGIRVWGVRTLSNSPEWQYVNVRRLFLTFKRKELINH